MGRKKIDWDSLDYKDYPLKNLLGKERRVQRMIEKRKDKIQKLKDSIKKEIQTINRNIMNLKGDLSDIRKVIVEKSKDVTNKGIYILRGDKWIRGKVRFMGKDKWVHVGKTSEWGSKSDDEIIEKIKEKLGKHFTKQKK
ncbi:MAG: hypothetical protein H8E71_00355 [Candidatus Marinimicrobia bacterium]|nr:hypothetical protein [Candidatus Neomarinimicrobiota bacterium]